MKTNQTQRWNACAATLKAIAHPMRLQIIDLLHQGGRRSVKDIYEELAINQAVASHHLGILKNKKVVESEREGKNIYYRLRDDNINLVIQNLSDLTLNSD